MSSIVSKQVSVTTLADGLVQSIVDTIEKDDHVFCTFGDLTEAFESVNHLTLFHILQSFGNSSLKIVQSY